VKVERSGDLIFWTYYMVDWGKVAQIPSDVKCLQCGEPMSNVEPVTDSKGKSYDGLVCHRCKRVIWVKGR
jgi:DNA-directed RNA polymerase subunit RPC12/RpoP